MDNEVADLLPARAEVVPSYIASELSLYSCVIFSLIIHGA